MKTIQNKILVILLLAITFTTNAQRNRFLEDNFEDEFLNKKFVKLKYLDDLNVYKKPCNCETDEIPNFSFSWVSSAFDTAVNNEILLKRARAKAKRDWFNKQKELIEKNIEEKLFRQFKSFEDAKNALFLQSELNNISKNSSPLKNKYSTRSNYQYNLSKKHLKELKLLQLRKSEITNGNINNSKYGYLKANGKFLKDIKDINSLNKSWNNIVIPLGSNISKSYYNKSILNKLNNLGTDFNRLIINLKNNYYNSFDEWEQLNFMQFLLNFEEYKKHNKVPYAYNPLFDKFKNIDKATAPVIENYAIKNRNGGISVFSDLYFKNLLSKAKQSGGNMYVGYSDMYSSVESQWNKEKKQALSNLVNGVNLGDLVLESGQNELDDLTKDIPWKKKTGKILNYTYTHIHIDGSRGYYKLKDGSIIVNSSSEQILTKAGDFRDKYNDFNPNDRYYYIKIAGSNEWAEMLFNPDNLADGLANFFKLAAIDLGKNLGRYVLPVEDIMVLINGKDFDGQDVSRLKAAGFLLLAIVPGSKGLKIIGKASDAVFVAVKLGSNTLVVDTIKKGLKVVIDNNIIKFLSKTGDEIARVVNGVMTFNYSGFGGKIITNPNKTTTVVGKYKVNGGVGTKNIIDSGLSKSGVNKGGINALSQTPKPKWNDQQIWENINEPWLRDAANRNDVIRVVSDPLNNNNLRNIDGSLTFFGREHELLTKPISHGGHGYTYNPITYTYTK